ncbi:NADP-dependent oxidoreductase [Allostreptomyces psammosilenae]|uniref:Enoyl reductase (ER) domain-containing protein n=1 Tax=Allostreptomyces psammosilenae TaxID=1892865 RepID=A0A852ZY39_9ACTN|nr:NADP-dependent oxidoreductase [Allostreptomyces psammosilenae]NYI06707.1 hypothetical protein [Allostreptomyces psammosilenae]
MPTPSAPSLTGREVHLVARPEGWPTPADFALREVTVPRPGPGQVVVRNLYLSVDPYMRGRMNDAESYVPPFRLDHVMEGGAVGRVVASEAEGLAPGDVVLHGLGWREYAVLDADRATRVDPELAPLTAYLGVLGLTGLTAYVGLLQAASFRAGDTVFVSGAAGAVGSVVGQIARLRGARRVVGSAGSAEKVRLLTERYGFDAAFNYKDGPVREQLAAALPEGVDVYFDNVGGEHLEAAIALANKGARMALCGAISQYNEAGEPVGPRNLARAIGWHIRLEGFLASDYPEQRGEFLREAAAWLRDGELVHDETVVDGIEHAVDAFLDMLRGRNIGKMLVRLPESPDEAPSGTSVGAS